MPKKDSLTGEKQVDLETKMNQNAEETVGSFIRENCKDTFLTFKTIKEKLMQNEEWSGFANYHKIDWQHNGWNNECKIHRQDLDYLFPLTGNIPMHVKEYADRLTSHNSNNEKISTEGKFLSFPCTSLVAKFQDPNFQTVYDSLTQNRLITQYYTFLPFDSLHMTLCAFQSEPPQFTPAPIGQWALDAKRQTEQTPDTVTLDGTRCYNIILLTVNVGPALKTRYDTITKTVGTQNTPEQYHISLAYQHQCTPISVQLNIEKLVEKKVNAFKKNHPTLQVESPTVIRFSTMAVSHRVETTSAEPSCRPR